LSTETPNTNAAKVKRPARVLLGWLDAAEAASWFVGHEADVYPTAEQIGLATQARTAVAARAVSPNHAVQAEVVTAPPPALTSYLRKLEQTSEFASMVSEGFSVAIADLSKLCALQPYVYTDRFTDRIATTESEILAGDLMALAALTLPIPTIGKPPAAKFDEELQAWILPSSNPNLRVIGPFNAELEPSGFAFGFIVGVTTSFLQVSAFNGRYFLRDGYHRAYGLLARGIKHVPVMLRDCATPEEFCPPPGMLPPEVCLGERPPMLTDYLDDHVAALIEMPASQKVIAIKASERNFIPENN